jgi:peptide/nickel transport system substrate-binding protein
MAMSLGTPSVHAQKDRQTLRFVPQATELKILDPVWTTGYTTQSRGYLVCGTLFCTDENLQVEPQMVDRTTVSTDGMKYSFTLRDGLRWQKAARVVGRLHGVTKALGEEGTDSDGFSWPIL